MRQFRFNVGPVSQPICWFNADKLSTTLAQHSPTLGLLRHCILSGSTPANTYLLPNTVSMLVQRFRRWPDIETALSDCPVFAWTAMRVTLFSSRRQKAATQITRCIGPMLMLCWAIVCETGPTYSKLIHLSPNHEYNCEYIFFLALF